MKRLKLILFTAAFLMSGVILAQNEEIKPKFEKQGELIKGTFYYEDGSVRQEGTYKDGRLHGEWISYDQNGEKTALANYENGKKSGKWFFWTENKLTEVDYQNSMIASVNSWKNENSIVDRQ
tara:strand:+ start:717 stop:1082 length:366 start_codon:yes stop_codon:yes gene_type:complete